MKKSNDAVPLIFVIASVLVSNFISSASSSQQNSFSDDEFQDAFDAMDKQEQVYGKLEEGVDSWEQRCLAVGGQEALDAWHKAQEKLLYCVIQNFDADKIQREIKQKKETGDLDLVFKKYCGKPVQRTRPCVGDFLEVSRKCLQSRDRRGLNVTLNMIDAAVDFVCHSNGDRLALFMSEDGMACLRENQEPILSCVKDSVPELFHSKNQGNIDLILFNDQNCGKGERIRLCIERALLKCPDSTPSNIINSMLLAMRKATPCQGISSRLSSVDSFASSWQLTLLAIFASLLILPRLN